MAYAVYSYDGKAIDYTPSSTVASGDVIVIGDGCAVSRLDIPANTLGAIHLTGVYTVAKATGVLAVGEKVYWDDTNKNVTSTVGSNTFFGRVVAAAASGDTTATVRLEHPGLSGTAAPITSSAATPSLTDNTGGTASATLAAPASTDFTTAEMKNIISSLAAKINTVLSACVTAGIIRTS